jgi:hypothetical protein
MSTKRKTPAKKKSANGQVAKTQFASTADFPKNRCRELFAQKGEKAAHTLALELGASQGKADRWMREFAVASKAVKKAAPKKKEAAKKNASPKSPSLNGVRAPKATHREHDFAA